MTGPPFPSSTATKPVSPGKLTVASLDWTTYERNSAGATKKSNYRQNLIPRTDTFMTRNFQNTHPPAQRSRLRIAANNPNPSSLPLNQHPQWTEFIDKLGEAVLTRHPDFRPHFLELLDYADLL